MTDKVEALEAIRNLSEHATLAEIIEMLSILEVIRRGEKDAGSYEDVAGFAKSADLDLIKQHGHVLTPGRYVGAEEVEDDGVPFEDKMNRLVAELNGQFAESAKLEKDIRANLGGLGFGD